MSEIQNHNPSPNDPDRYFRTDHIEADLKRRSLRGGFVTMVGQVGKFILRTASTIILARLLTPQDYGLIGMVTVITGFLDQFKDLGLSLATIQRANINHKQVSTLFWLNIGLSCGLVLLTIALAPTIARFYGEPRLIWITIAIAAGFLIGGLAIQHQALLRRQMRFADLAAIDLTSMCVGLIVGTISAWYGLGYWSLVILLLSQTLTTTIGVWILCGWRPTWPVRHSGIRSMVTFGGNFTGFSLVNYFSRNMDNVIIGAYLGAEQLGLYAKAYQLLLLPIDQIALPLRSVAIPTLCRLQNDPKRYCAYYHKAILLMVSLGMPLVAFTMVTANNLIRTLLGPQWTDAVQMFQVLGVAAFLGTFNMAAGWVFISFGRTDRQFYWSAISSALTVISFIIGIRWGAIGVAAGYSISRVLLQIPGIVYAYQDSPLRLKDLGSTIFQPAISSIGAAIALMGIHIWLLKSSEGAIYLLVDSVLYILLYFGIWIILPHGRQEIMSILGLLKDLRGKQKSV
ncbi:MAG TPA: lipopolysaccharide biosynthesis protein [Leptolyngbyaceae cyanobacterium]